MTFDKTRLPDPLDYFQGRGQKIFSKTSKKFRTTCAIHGSTSGTISVERDTGLWHCFSCMAGGDIPAYEMQVTGADFVTAVTALGAWVDTGEPHQTIARKPISKCEAEEALLFERTLLAIVQADKRRGAASEADIARAELASQRIQKIQGAFQ